MHPNTPSQRYPNGDGDTEPKRQLTTILIGGTVSPLHPFAPFGHIFHVHSQKYYFDVPTNQIVEVEPALGEVLPLFGTLSQRDLISKLRARWPIQTILDACAIIETARQEEGLFLSQRPQLIPSHLIQIEDQPFDKHLRHLILTITNRCNLRCKYCVHGASLDWVRGHGKKSMPYDVAQESLSYFLDRVDPNMSPMISFYGGEPLLEFDLIQKVIAEGRKHPHGKDAIFIIDTNGVLLTDEVIDLVIKEGVHLQVSIDGPELWHDRNRVDTFGNGTLKRILSNLDKLLAADSASSKRLSFTATLAPPMDFFELAEFFAEFPPFVRNGINAPLNLRVSLANLNGLDWDAKTDDYLALYRQVDQAQAMYLEAVLAGNRETLNPVVLEMFEPELAKFHLRSRVKLGEKCIPGGNCQPGIRKLHVSVDGQFHPCERTGKNMEIGGSCRGIEAKKIDAIQEGFYNWVKTNCSNCWALRFCGVCFATQAEYAFGDNPVVQVPETVCDSIRKGKERTLQMYASIIQLPEEKRKFLEAWSME